MAIINIERYGDYVVQRHQSRVPSDYFYAVVFDGVEDVHTPATGNVLRSFHYLRNARKEARRLAEGSR